MKNWLKKNKKNAKKHGYDRHYYVEKLGIPIEKCGVNFCDNNDKRYKKWMKQRKKYGFDVRETWNLDSIFFEWLYERLCMYKKEASKIVNLSYHKFDVNGNEMTQIDIINQMIEDLKFIIINEYNFDKNDDINKAQERVLKMWGVVLPCMWW